MKKILSLTLAALMVVSMVPTAFAYEYTSSDEEEGASLPSTHIVYTASENDEIGDTNGDGVNDNQTYWIVTVPAEMKPGTTAQVTVAGTWESTYDVYVTCRHNITMIKDGDIMNGSRDLEVTFPNFYVQGDDLNPVSASQDISVEDFNALFGEWAGRIDYEVDYMSHS